MSAAQVSVLPPSGIQITPSGSAPGTILLGDLPACKAVVHIVDRVMLPTLVSAPAQSLSHI